MIPVSDLGLIGLRPKEPPQDALPWMTYAVTREAGAWRILFHGAKASRFDSFEAALEFARHLARECAALGCDACVLSSPDAPASSAETYAARGPAFAGFFAPHEA